MPFEFGDIVLVRFPFTNQAAFKQRPAVIVSNSSYNEARLDIVIMAITSQIPETPALGEVWITQWQVANLVKPSAVKPVFATVEKTLILKSLGALHPFDRTSLREAILAVLG